MLKSEMIQEFINEVKEVKCQIVKVYGVSHGVGYDMNIKVLFKNGDSTILEAHALRQSWACLNHLRSNQDEFKLYTGSNDIYRDEVVNYWEKKSASALSQYFNRFRKGDLINVLTIHRMQ